MKLNWKSEELILVQFRHVPEREVEKKKFGMEEEKAEEIPFWGFDFGKFVLSKTKKVDLFSILNCSFDCDLKTIKEKYKELAKQLHPDKNSNPNSSETFQQIQNAWEILRDDEKRIAYVKNQKGLKRPLENLNSLI